jgi:hypothetical protein
MKSILKRFGEWDIDLKLKVFLRFILSLSYVFLLIVKSVQNEKRSSRMHSLEFFRFKRMVDDNYYSFEHVVKV